MEKVCRDWAGQAFGDGLIKTKFWNDFEKNAKAAAAEVYRVKDFAEAEAKLKELLKVYGDYTTRGIMAVGGDEKPALKGIYDRIAQSGTAVYTDRKDIYRNRATADVGITVAEFCVAETGSVVVDNYAYEARVASMLPYVNVVFVNANYVVENVSVACEIMGRAQKKGSPTGYLGFVTGPSRTADIERVLSLGVHGPNKLLVIAVEKYEEGK